MHAPARPQRTRTLRGVVTALVAAVALLMPLGALQASAEEPPTVGSISGLVSDDGTPLEGVYVYAWSMGGGSAQAYTDESGLYLFSDLPFGEYTVGASVDPIYKSPIVPPVVITEIDPNAVVDIALERWPTGDSSIVGTVTDAATGAALSGGSIGVLGTGTPYQGHAWVGEDGTFALPNLPAGSYNLSVYAQGYAALHRVVTVAAGETVTSDFALVPTNSGIAGVVSDAEGNQLSSVRVTATLDGVTTLTAFTNGQGQYTFGPLVAGTYNVSAGGRGTPYVQSTVTVVAAANEVAALDIVLQPRTTGSIGGYVLTEDGFAAEGVCVNAYDVGTGDRVGAETRTSTEATYRINDLVPGIYTLRFSDCDHDGKPTYRSAFLGGVSEIADATTITLAAGTDRNAGEMILEFKDKRHADQ